MCAGVCVWCINVFACVCAHRSQKKTLECSIPSLTEFGARLVATGFQGSPCLHPASQHWAYRHICTMASFLHGGWGFELVCPCLCSHPQPSQSSCAITDNFLASAFPALPLGIILDHCFSIFPMLRLFNIVPLL